MKRAAIISGGGRNGAYFAGLLSKTKPEYSAVYGNSAGANMAINVALSLYNELAESYGKLSNEDIWKRSPLKRNGKINWVKSIWNLLWKNGAGDMGAHLDYLNREIHSDLWKGFKSSGKTVKIANVHLGYEPIKLFIDDISKTSDRKYALERIHYSSAFWPLTEAINGVHVDGGHMETLLVDEAIKDGYKPEDIDVYICRKKPEIKHVGKPKNWFQTAIRIIAGYRHVIVYEDLIRAIEQGKVLEQNVRWLPYEPGIDSMNFDPKIMKKLVQMGKRDA
jgi:hypothetical protein